MSGGWKQDTSSDADAIHDNVAGEIDAITEKATPVNADLVLIEDSADSNNKKKAQLGNLPGGGSGSVTFSGAGVYRATSDQAIASSTVTAISFNAEEWDTDTYHDNTTNPSRLTVPNTSKYAVVGAVTARNIPSGAGDTQIRLAVNGSLARVFFRGQMEAFDNSGTVTLPFATELDLTAGDYVEIQVFVQNNGFDIRFGSTWTFCEIHELAGS